ncbi:hypothetical protein [Salinarimonas ramus]|uniref:Beta-barrel assembly complex subunit BamF n=1 Tax=Salinarimonas ramus TaxID=690164 RepID=A0A917V7S7_9HYPH|nr:hypothetical protein [Salinarimonas ramus]GGK48324.1 hypothetical protein GCM10011322_39110 [Salinarimonas ramus]
MTAIWRRMVTAAGLALAVATLGGCAGDLNPVRDVFASVGATAPQQAAPGFIEESRPAAEADYLPIAPAPARETAPKTQAEVEAARAELEAALAETNARGARARRLAIGPAPEPVAVEPLPAIEDDIAPPPSTR